MKIAEIAVRRPVTTCMFIASLVLLGIISWQQLPVQLFPDLVFPVLGVWAGYYPGFNVGTTPSEIEEKLTIPIENAVASLPHVKKINSWTWTNGCWTWVEMGFGSDMRFSAIELQERLEALLDFAVDYESLEDRAEEMEEVVGKIREMQEGPAVPDDDLRYIG